MQEMQRKIAAFVQSGEQTLLLAHEGKRNVLYEWSKIRNPVRMLTNSIVIRISKFAPLRLKAILLRMIGMKIGKNTGIGPETEIDPYHPELITIDDDAIIGWKVNMLCHEFTPNHIRLGRITLKRGAMVGAFCSIRSGVTIGEHAIVAMDSFVNSNIPPGELWGGVPARFIKKLSVNNNNG